MTGVADTRLLLTLEFPPTEETKRKIVALVEKEIARHLLMPSIVLTEFIKFAGSRMGEEAAKTRLRLLCDRGMRVIALDETAALTAGSLLLSCRNTPISDALIASFVKNGVADYVLTDDQHFDILGVKTKWL